MTEPEPIETGGSEFKEKDRRTEGERKGDRKRKGQSRRKGYKPFNDISRGSRS